MGQSNTHIGQKALALWNKQTPHHSRWAAIEAVDTKVHPSAPKQTEACKACSYNWHTSPVSFLVFLRTASNFNFLLTVKIYSNANKKENIIAVKELNGFLSIFSTFFSEC